MKALSVRQPWAELIARGSKFYEIRTWTTAHRGDLLICAGGRWHPLGVALHGEIGERGVAVCVVDLVDVEPLEVRHSGGACLNTRGLRGYAWLLQNPRRVEPLEVKGRLSIFEPADLPRFLDLT